MSIYVDKDTKVIVQGITGSAGMDHTEQMLKYGTKIVAGVTPGKGGTKTLGVPVYNTVEDAVKATVKDILNDLDREIKEQTGIKYIISDAEKEWKDKYDQRDLQRLRGLRLMDDDFMSKCFENNIECTELVLHIVLG